MREKERIARILNSFKEIWELKQDLRFFQLLEIIQHEMKYTKDLFYLEDTEFEKWLTEFKNRV